MNNTLVSDANNSFKVYAAGDPDSTPVVLIHGGAGGIWTWEKMIRHLDRFYCLMVELPEHGTSVSNHPLTIQRAATQVIGFLQQRSLQGKAHVFGLSVGGQVVVEMLSRAPTLFKSAIISGALCLPVPGYNLGLYSEKIMSLIYHLGIRPLRGSDTWIKLSMKVTSGIPDPFFPSFKQNFQEMTPGGWTHAMAEYYRYRMPAGLEQTHIPVLLMAGAHETIDVRPTNRLLNKAIPGSRSMLVGENGKFTAVEEHNWCMTMPELCAQTIEAWVTHKPLPGLLTPEGISEHGSDDL
jgi:pimeloyl-ACP methyl ester carboxylesterase